MNIRRSVGVSGPSAARQAPAPLASQSLIAGRWSSQMPMIRRRRSPASSSRKR